MERLNEKSFGRYILLSIVTLGLYRIYFYYTLGRDINTLCEDDGKESPSYLTALILGSVTFGIFPKYWIYQLGQRLHVNAPRYGFKMVETGYDTVVLDIIPGMGFICTYVFIKNYNRMADAYNSAHAA